MSLYNVCGRGEKIKREMPKNINIQPFLQSSNATRSEKSVVPRLKLIFLARGDACAQHLDPKKDKKKTGVEISTRFPPGRVINQRKYPLENVGHTLSCLTTGQIVNLSLACWPYLLIACYNLLIHWLYIHSSFTIFLMETSILLFNCYFCYFQ